MGFINVTLKIRTLWLYFQISKTDKRNTLTVLIVMCHRSFETNGYMILISKNIKIISVRDGGFFDY